jgi:hypothetical protein
MQFIHRAKVLAGLGIGAAAMAVAVPAVGLAASTPAPAVSVSETTFGCMYQVDAQNINLYRTPGGARIGVMQDGQFVYSVPRRVVNGPDGTRYAFVMLQEPFKDVGFVNKTFLKDEGCTTPEHSK